MNESFTERHNIDTEDENIAHGIIFGEAQCNHRLDGPAIEMVDPSRQHLVYYSAWWIAGARLDTQKEFIDAAKNFDPTLTDEHFLAVFLKYPFHKPRNII